MLQFTSRSDAPRCEKPGLFKKELLKSSSESFSSLYNPILNAGFPRPNPEPIFGFLPPEIFT